MLSYSSEEHVIRRMSNLASSRAESSRSFRVKGRGLRRQTSSLQRLETVIKREEDKDKDTNPEDSSFLARVLNNKKLELELRSCKMQLEEAMMNNSRLDESRVQLEFTVEDLKNRLSDMEEEILVVKQALQFKSKELMECQYQKKRLAEQLGLPLEAMEASQGEEEGLKKDEKDDDDDDDNTKEPSPFEERDRLKLALDQWNLAESELSAVIDENLILNRERDAALALVQTLKNTATTAEIDRDNALLDLEDKRKEADHLLKDNNDLISHLKKSFKDAGTMTEIATPAEPEPEPEAKESLYSDGDLNEAFSSLEEEQSITEAMKMAGVNEDGVDSGLAAKQEGSPVREQEKEEEAKDSAGSSTTDSAKAEDAGAMPSSSDQLVVTESRNGLSPLKEAENEDENETLTDSDVQAGVVNTGSSVVGHNGLESKELKASISSHQSTSSLLEDYSFSNSVLVSASVVVIGHHAGTLSVDDSVLTISWPEEAVYPSTTQEFFCTAVQGSNYYPTLRPNEVLLSPFVYTSSCNAIFRKSLTIEIPHCALIDSGGWEVTVMRNSRLLSESPHWEALASWAWPEMGPSDVGSCQLSSEVFRVDTSSLEAYVMIGRLLDSDEGGSGSVGGDMYPMKRLALAGFAKIEEGNESDGDGDGSCLHLKLVCASDLKEQQKCVEHVESERGWKVVGPWTPLIATGDGSDIEVNLLSLSDKLTSENGATKLLKYDLFWPGLLCPSISFSFSLEGIINSEDLTVSSNVGQKGEAGEHDEQILSVTIPLKSLRSTPPDVPSLLTSPWRAILPFSAATELGCILDRDHPLGNDWRHVAYILGLTDSERRSLERMSQPTQYILSKLPVLGDGRNTLQGLLDALFRIERPDAVNVVADYLNSL